MRGGAARERLRRFAAGAPCEPGRKSSAGWLSLRLPLAGVRLRISFWFFAVVLAFVLLDREVLAFYLALPVAVHEMGHLLVMTLCGVGVEEISLTPFSVDIRRSKAKLLGYGRELCISLAGIAANALMALYLHLFAFHSVRTMFLVGANLAVALFNLLPIGSLDGGEAVRLLGARWGSPDFAWRLSRIASFFTLAPLSAAAVLLCLQGSPNPTLLITCVYLGATLIAQD